MGFLGFLFFFLGILIFFSFVLYLYAKAIDECCMVKIISSEKLREGDWLYSNIKIGNKLIKANWDGLSKKEIREIMRTHKKVKIREGVVFSPVFLIAFILWVISFFAGFNLWNSFW